MTRFALALCFVLLASPVFADPASGSVPSISPQEAQALVRNDKAILVDVREPAEAADGMAQPAVLVPTSEMKSDSPAWRQFVAGLDHERKVVVYCASGGRAAAVGEKLARLGFDVVNMGEFSSWEKAGLPVKKHVPAQK